MADLEDALYERTCSSIRRVLEDESLAADEAIVLAGQCCALLEERGPGDADGRGGPLRELLSTLAEHLSKWRDGDRIEALFRRLVEFSERVFGPRSLELAEDLVWLGRFLADGRRSSEAESCLRRALDLLTGFPQSKAQAAVAVYWLAVAVWEGEGEGKGEGDRSGAEALMREAVARHAGVVGEHGEGTLFVRQELAGILWGLERWDEAEAEFSTLVRDARIHHPESPVSERAEAALTRFRRSRLRVDVEGRLYGWALSLLRETHGDDRFELAVAMLRAVAGQMEQTADQDRLEAEAATLLAAAGRVDEAAGIVRSRLMSSWGNWDGARVHARIIATLKARGDRDAVTRALERAVSEARDATIIEGSEDQALYDLVEVLEDEERSLAVSLLPEGDKDLARALVIAGRVEAEDIDGALRILGDGDSSDPSTLCSIAELAVRKGRGDIVRRLVPRLEKTDMAHSGVGLLFDAGARDEAMTLLSALEPGWARAEGLSMAAEYFGGRGERDAFTRHAVGCAEELVVHKIGFAFQSLFRIASGALASMEPGEAIPWGGAHLPPALHADFTEAVARLLTRSGRRAEARTVASALDEPRRLRLLETLDHEDRNENAVDALQHSRHLTERGDWDSSVSALASLGDSIAFVDACLQIAEDAAAAGSPDGASLALRAAFNRLPGPYAAPPAVVIAKEHIRLGRGRRLGEAAARLLPREWSGALAEAALLRAARMDDIPAATPFVLVAGYASLEVVS